MAPMMWINNEFVPSADSRTFAVHDPATEEVIDEVPQGGAADARRAIDAAGAAFREWRKIPAGERAELLHEVAHKLRAKADELATLLTRE
ncbi:MAG TPA: aldehyde dehydrogenase family protein, partial [Herpetosiphonaceae bacterium]